MRMVEQRRHLTRYTKIDFVFNDAQFEVTVTLPITSEGNLYTDCTSNFKHNDTASDVRSAYYQNSIFV